MKFTHWLVTLAVLAVPAAATPTTYYMAFTGGIVIGPNNIIPFAPESGSFTYDPNSGFSNFLIQYNKETFDFTAAANTDYTTVFNLFPEEPNWASVEIESGGVVVTQLSLSGVISATNTLFPGFSLGDLPRSGFFTMSTTPTPPPSSVPEPATASALSLAALGLLSYTRLRSRKRAKSNG